VRHSAVVIGSGPNGLAAAVRLAQAGLQVEVREAADVLGGGARTGELTLPGFRHDLGSAVHPFARSSPYFSKLPLEEHGVRWIHPPVPVAHPLDDGTAVLLHRDLGATIAQFSRNDGEAYKRIFRPLVDQWAALMKDVLQPPARIPRHPFLLARFGVRAIQRATVLAAQTFEDERPRALFAGNAAHSFLPLENPLSSAFGMILGGSGHAVGWPIPAGGSQSISNALANFLSSLGGRVRVSAPVDSLAEVRGADLVLCDVVPKEFVRLAGNALPPMFCQLLERYRYGPGIFKMDWALREPIPWRAAECRDAGTVHIGGTLGEIAASERAAWTAAPDAKPFVLLSQPSLFDRERAPEGRHTAWAYCHVPNAWPGSMVERIEAQIERFAPGFRDCILARASHGTRAMEAMNRNLVGGDISGGAVDGAQFVLRPTWRQYSTPLPGVYLCSSSTPPGGGVHGMCGYNAAERALKWLNSRR
jgi:phytoene dehydrogenase-like protein